MEEKGVFNLCLCLSDNCKDNFEPKCCCLVSTVPSQPDNQFSHPDKLKRMSKSVPAFLQDEASFFFVSSEKWNQIGGLALLRLVCVFPRWQGLTLAFPINRGSVVDPGTRQGMSHLTPTVTPFGSEVKLHRFGNVTFVSKWVQK